jgi:transposase
MSKVRFVGLDVHAATIAVAVGEGRDGEIRSLGVIPNREGSIRKVVRKLGRVGQLRVCYEAGPTGYALYWQLAELGVTCEVVAPTLIPVKAGDRVKTDRRDAMKLARLYRAGELTPVWVPDRSHEALRDLVRAREDAKQDQTRARHRLSKFLLRHGKRPPATIKRNWTQKHMNWIVREVELELPAQKATLNDYVDEVRHCGERIEKLERAIGESVQTAPKAIQAVVSGLQALRGVGQLSAVTIVSELGQVSRFSTPRQLMSYSGLVPGEHSSGSQIRRGAITKTGNAHLRRVLVESAWAYRHRPAVGGLLKKRQQGLDPGVRELAWKAQRRLHSRYRHLTERGKNRQQTITSIGRELLGFIWAIAVEIETQQQAEAA